MYEMLIASAVNDRMKENSINFSSYSDMLIFFRGIDRGGEDLIDMILCGNRKNGNTGEYCVPVAVLEDGAESYANCKLTVLSAARNKVLLKLQDSKCHFFTIFRKTFASAEGHTTESMDSRCIMVEFIAPENTECHPSNIHVCTDFMAEELTYSAGTIEQFYSTAKCATKDSEVVDAIHLDSGMLISSHDGKYTLATNIHTSTRLANCNRTRIILPWSQIIVWPW
jgi:hypothetical protein